MTILSASKEIEQLINEHHVYAVESLINDIVYGSADEPYIDENVITTLVQSAYERMRIDKKGGII